MQDEEKNNQSQPRIPPSGDIKKAQKYIEKLVNLVDAEKIMAVQTNLTQFDPNSFQDHYRVNLQDYQIEISHSKLPNSGEDTYMMVFTNLQKIRDEQSAGEECTNKVILAYTKLTPQQYHQFKTSAQKQIEIIKKREEEKRFDDALKPIDNLLDHPDFEEKSESTGEEVGIEPEKIQKDDLVLSPQKPDLSVPQVSQI